MPRFHPVLLLAPLVFAACARSPEPREAVTHEERALAKANAAWAQLYTQRADETFSPKNVQRFAPYTATLENDVWTVHGAVPANVHGAAPAARIRAQDGVTTVQVEQR